MAVDVVVVNYRTEHLLTDFIESFYKTAFNGCTINVVDVDPAQDMRIYPHWAHVLQSTDREGGFSRFRENIGYARACNAGAKNGKNEIILLANADTVLSDGFKECHDALMRNPEWGILGPRQTDESNRITAGGIFGTETNIGQRGWQEPDQGQYSDIRDDAKSVSGSLYFIKRRLWDLLTKCSYMQQYAPGIEGAFIPTPHYYEETACSYHARAHGYKCVFYGPVKMIHYWHKASTHGGWADRQVEVSKAMMREFLDLHGIIHE